MRYKLSPDLVLTDQSSSTVINLESGEKFDAGEEGLEILFCFAMPISIEDAISHFEVGDQGETNLKTFINSAIDARLLIEDGDVSSERAYLARADRAKLERPTKPMFGCPFRELNDVECGEIVFLGVPFDLGTTGFPGARFAPDALREAASETYEYHLELLTRGMRGWYFDPLGRKILEGARMCDVGNVAHVVGEPYQSLFSRIRMVTEQIYAMGAFPVILGGDHSITYSTVPPLKSTLVHVDAHSDLAEWDSEIFHNHGNVLTRIVAEELVERIYQFGLRVTSGAEDHADPGIPIEHCDLTRPGHTAGVTERRIFVSLDIDVLDPAFAPGTGTPVPNGLTTAQLFGLLEEIASASQAIGLEIVEVCPMRDPTGITSRTAVDVILCFLGAWYEGTFDRKAKSSAG